MITDVAIYSAIVGEIAFMIGIGIFMRLGGWPEGYYRIFRIKYFVFFILDADHTPIRHLDKMSHLLVKSPVHFNFEGKTYYPDTTQTTRSKGRPSWYFQPDQSISIPMVNGYRDKILNPETINKAYRINILQNIRALQKDRSQKHNGRWALLIIVLVMLALFGVLTFVR